MKCGICKTSTIETDTARDISYCTGCGLVIEESTIVSDVQFMQDAKGTSILQGQYIAAGDSKKLVGGRFITTNHTANIKAIAKTIGESLGIGETQIDGALRWYNLSLQFNFTKGRKTQVLLAACLYITCREEETPHMLIDFASVLRVNVFKIGSMFLKLVRLLNITVPLVDPSLYVPRFCSKLQLTGQSVPKTALRMIARMSRDWMIIGRKPAGICGAAILVASRMHNAARTVEEVASVVKVCEATINKRLAEMSDTATATLSVSEFNTIWLEKEEDPPIIKIRSKQQIKQMKERAKEESENRHNAQNRENKIKEDTEEPTTPQSISTCQLEEGSDDANLSSEGMEIESDTFLSHEEVKEKEKIWEATHREYLIEKKKKEVKQRTKPRKQKAQQLPLEEAVEHAVRTKNLSSRINYTAIKSLFQK